jgi:hypothetical protein
VDGSVEFGLYRRSRRPGSEHAEAGRDGDRAQPLAQADPDRLRAADGPPVAHLPPDPPQSVGEAALDVDLTEHVRLRQPELVRVPQQPTQRHRGVDDEHRTVGGADLAAIPGPQPHRQLVTEHSANELRELSCDSTLDGQVGGHVSALPNTNWCTSR